MSDTKDIEPVLGLTPNVLTTDRSVSYIEY